jgi:ubiquinone/menaquinone biosynthesis C-methylase UbiE
LRTLCLSKLYKSCDHILLYGRPPEDEASCDLSSWNVNMTYDTDNAYNDDGRLEKEQSFWKAAAEGYDDWIADDFEDQYEVNWNILTKYIDPTLRVLDVGCGPGDLSIRISQQCHEVRGVDVTPEMIRIAEEKAACAPANVCFQQADACDLPFESHSFDTVMSVNALQTMIRPEMALSEMSRVLKPGGELLLITYCYGDSSLSDSESLIHWAIKYGTQAVWQSFKLTQLVDLLQTSGFEVVEADRIWEKPVVAFLRGRSITS